MKKISSVGTILLTCALLTGCYQQKTNMEIKNNDSVSLTIEAIAKKGNQVESTVRKILKTAKVDIENEGFKIKLIDTKDEMGLKAAKSFKDVKKLKVGDIFKNKGIMNSKDFNEKFIKEVKGNTYIIDFTLDKSDGEKSSNPKINDMVKNIKVQFTLTLPSAPIVNNANNISNDGKTLTWDIPLDEVTPIKVEYKKQTFQVPIAMGGIVLIGGLGVLFFIRKRK
jgi:hypothetical protein